MRTAILTVHVLAGTLGLLLGPIAVARPAPAGWAARLGLAYQLAVAVLSSTAVALAVLATQLWWLGVVGVLTAVGALSGWQARRHGRPGWRGRHLRLVGGSYIALLTALAVVSVSAPLVWLLPTAVGAPLIERAAAKQGSRTSSPLVSA